jgi:epoxyqueuosine reductase
MFGDGDRSMTKGEQEQFKALLKKQAKREGFDLVGVTTPDSPPHFDVYQEWLRAGHHGEMGYLATDRALEGRRDPRKIMPHCRSILVLATSYRTPSTESTGGQSPAVAAYALGDDYHDVFKERMARLMNWIEEQVGRPVEHRSYTDTGPVLERELAQRSGLGWIGKNTCLINPEVGSFLLIAEILLALDLPPDEPFHEDRCGTCRRCLEACPTGCILPDRTLDARRCISYLTIELKRDIPAELRPLLGNWIFGCDVCQQVCPWNVRFAKGKRDAAFHPRPFLEQPDLRAFLDLQPASFQELLRGSPLKRAKRHGLVRNAAVAAGARAEKPLAPALVRVLREDEHAMARSHAAWALGRIGGSEAREALQIALGLESDGRVVEEIQAALAAMAANKQ